MRRLGLGGPRQRRTVHRDGLAVEHGQTGFLFLELRFDVGLEGVELSEKPGEGGLDLHLRGRTRRGSLRPGFAFSFLHPSLSLTTALGRHHASISLASRKLSARVRARLRDLLRVGGIGLHPRLGEHREGDERHLPELDLVQEPPAARGLLAPERAVADRQPVDRAGLQQRLRLARRLHLEDQPALDPEPLAVLAHLVPDADRPGRVVLPQHLHPRAQLGEPGQRGAVGALLHHVPALVGGAEQAGVAGDLGAVLQREPAGEAAELRLERARPAAAIEHLHSLRTR